MIRKTILALSLSLLYLAGTSQRLYNDKISVKVGDPSATVNAVIYLPQNFDRSKQYPLVIFTHGIGEHGTDVNKLYDTGLPKVLKQGYKPSFDFIMVAPQSNWFSADPAWLPGILEDAQRRWNIDESRIYLTGLSAGGWCVYGSQLNISQKFAKKIAAIEINSGVNGSTNKKNFDWWKKSKTPVWAVVGSYDKVYLAQNTYMVNEINKRVPGLATLTVRPGIGHGNWDDVYSGKVKLNGKTMWEWLYQYTRGGKKNNDDDDDNGDDDTDTDNNGGNNGSTGTPVPPVPPVTPNKAPVAKAGDDKTITLPTSSLYVSGGASDADGWVTNYKWTKISGPDSYRIENENSGGTNFTNLTVGTYVFRLAVTDNDNATDYDDVTITVKPQPVRTTFYATARADDNDISLPKNSVTLLGSGTDYAGNVTGYYWEKVSGPSSYYLANPYAARTVLGSLTPGTYVFRLIVTDNRGIKTSDKVTITVRD